MSQRKSSKSMLPVICSGGLKDTQGPAGLPSDGNTGKLPLVTREDVISESLKGPDSLHPSCKVNEAHEFDDFCSNKPADSSSNSDSSSDSDSSSNSSSSSESSKSKSGGTGSSPGRSGKSGSAKGGGTDKGGYSKPKDSQETQDTDDEDIEVDDQDDKSSRYREEKSGNEEMDVDVEGDDVDIDGDDPDEARKILTLPPQGPKKRDTDTELDKQRENWFINEMNVILDRRLGPNHIPFEWFQTEIDEVVARHKQYSAGVMHKCDLCENLPHEQKPCISYKMFFRSDGTKISEDESKEKFVQDMHTVIKFYLEEEKFLDWSGEKGRAIPQDPSTPPSSPGSPAPSSPDLLASSAPVPSNSVPRPELSEHLEKYFWDLYTERCLKRSRLTNKMCVTHAIKTGLTREQVHAIFDKYEADRKQRKPLIKHSDKNWKIGTEILQKWQRDNPRAATDEDYEWLTAQTGRSKQQLSNSLKQYRRKVLGLHASKVYTEDHPQAKSHVKADKEDHPQAKSHVKVDEEDHPQAKSRFPRQAAPTAGGGKPAAFKEKLEEKGTSDDQRALASTSKVLKNKRQATSRRLSDEGAPKVARTVNGEDIGPQAGEKAPGTRILQNKRQASSRKLSGEGPGKVAKSAAEAETGGIIGTEPPTSVAQGSDIQPKDDDITFNLDHLPIFYDSNPSEAWNPTRPAQPDVAGSLIQDLFFDDIQDLDIYGELAPLHEAPDLAETEMGMYADNLNKNIDNYLAEEHQFNDLFEAEEEEAVASRQSAIPKKPRTKPTRQANSQAFPAPDKQTFYFDHDYDWFAQEIWGQMGGPKGPAIFPSAQEKIGPVVQKYENWSKGNLRHLQQDCDDSIDANVCCYKTFDPTMDGDQVLLEFKAEIIRTINQMVQATKGIKRLWQFPQHAKDVLWEFSGRFDAEYRLSPIDRKALLKKTGLTDEQIQKWWYHFHNQRKPKQKIEVPATPNAQNSTRKPNIVPVVEVPEEETDSDNTTNVDEEIMEPHEDDTWDYESSVQPFRSGIYESSYQHIWADMGGSKGESKFPGVEAAVQPIIDLYKLWVQGRSHHLHKRCDASSDPLSCCWTRKFGPPKKPQQVFLEFQVEVTQTINNIIKESKITQPSLRLYKFPEFSRKNMLKFSASFNNTLHDLDQNDMAYLKRQTGLETGQIRKWWEQYHNRAIKEGKMGAPISTKGGEIPKENIDVPSTEDGEIPKEDIGVSTCKTQRGQQIDTLTLGKIFVEIVDKMIGLSWASVFAKHVSKEEAPDYLKFVEIPMDLDTIKKKASKHVYKNEGQFRADVWQIVLNAHNYYDNEASLLYKMPIPQFADMLINKVDEELTNRKDEIKACVGRYNDEIKSKKTTSGTTKAQKKSRKEARVDLAGLANILGSIIDNLCKLNMEPFPKDLFVKPVSRLEAPDYLELVKNPMDLGMIRKKALQMEYKSQEEFCLDVKQIVTNAHQYNDKKYKSKSGDSRIPPRAESLFQICNKELKMRQKEIEACMTQS